MIFVLIFGFLSSSAMAQGGSGNTGGINIHGMVHCPNLVAKPVASDDYFIKPQVTVNRDWVQIRLPENNVPAENLTLPTEESVFRPHFNARQIEMVQDIIKTIPKVEQVQFVPSTTEPFIRVRSRERPEIVFDQLVDSKVICQ